LCNIIVLNVHATSEEKSDGPKDSFYEELEQAFHHYPKYHIKILLGDFNSKVEREDIFKPTVGMDALHRDSNDNCVRIVHFVISKHPVVTNTMFLQQNIHKNTWTLLMGRFTTRLITY